MRNKPAFLMVAIVLVLLLVPSVYLPASGIVQSAYNLIESAGTPITKRTTVNFTGTITCTDAGGISVCNGTNSGGTANQNIRSIGAAFDGGGSALTAGGTVTTFVTVPFACTIAGYNITADTGTVSFDVWKIATGTAIPTVANSILTGGFLALSSGTALHSASTVLFTTTASAANDIYGINLEAVSGATKVSLVIQCNAT